MSKCPNCGAPLEGNKCSYCQHVVEEEDNAGNGKIVHNIYINGAPSQQQQNQQQQTQQHNNQRSNDEQQYNQRNRYASDKSKGTVLIIWFLLGIIGGHRFYVGKVGSGILYFCTVGFFGLGWIYDLFKILSGTFQDGNGLPIK